MKPLLLSAAALTCTALLGSCSKLTPPSDTTPALTIEGRVASTPLPASVSYTPAAGGLTLSAPVAENGSFSLALPQTMESAQLSSPSTALSMTGCTGEAKESESGVRLAALFSLNDGNRSFVSGTTKTSTIPPRVEVILEGLVYSNAATQVTGQLDCASMLRIGSPVPVNVGLSLVRGWNRVHLSLEGNIDLSGTVRASGMLSSGGSPTTQWKTMQDLTSNLKFF